MKPSSILFVEASTTGAGEVACAYAHSKGLHVTLLSSEPRRYGQTIRQHCDHIVSVDTTSISALRAFANAYASTHRVIATTTTSDFHVVQAAALAKYLKLPGNPPQVVQTLKNKFKMRQAIDQIAPELNPTYRQATAFRDAHAFAQDTGFPIVAKPLTGNDSVHIRRLHNSKELQRYFDRRKHWGLDASGQAFAKGVLLEEVIDGPEYCIDFLKAQDGPLTSIGSFTKAIEGEERGYFIKIGATYPAPQAAHQQLLNAIAPIIAQLGFEVGAVNVDCRIRDGQVKILEINPRLVGDQMGSHMIEIATGQNPARAIVDLACGQALDWTPSRQRAVAIHRIVMPAAGRFKGITNLPQLAGIGHVSAVNQLAPLNSWVGVADSNQGVIGSVIVSHESACKATNLAKAIAARACVSVDTQPNKEA